MRTHTRGACVLAIAGLCVLQHVRAQSYVFFSPPASNVLPGNSVSQVMVGASASHQSRVQQIDVNFIGNPLFSVVHGIAFRGDENGAPGANPRSVELEVRMGHADVASISSQFDTNYLTPPQVVFPRGCIPVPDWQAPQAIDGYTFEIPFSTPFQYNLADALVWEVRVYSSSGGTGPYVQDFYSIVPAANFSQLHAELRPGCSTPNGEFRMRAAMQSIPGTLGLGFGVDNAPPGAGVILLMGGPLFFSQLPVPGLCAGLGTDAVIQFPIGVADAAGTIPLVLAATPWSAGVAGIAFSFQAAALDPSQSPWPLALSTSIVLSVPRTDGVPTLGCWRVFQQGSPDAVFGTGPSASAVPVRFTLQ